MDYSQRLEDANEKIWLCIYYTRDVYPHKQELWSRGSHSSSSDASVFLNENDYSAISALLEPLVSAMNTTNKNLKAQLHSTTTQQHPKAVCHCIVLLNTHGPMRHTNSTQYVGYGDMVIAAEQHWREEQSFQMNMNLNDLN